MRKAKETEALDLHDQNLSLKIEMTHLQEQLDQDLAIKEELHRKEIEHI